SEAWPCHRGSNRASVERYSAGGARFALSRALSVRSARLDQSRVGCFRQQPQSALLQTDGGRAQTTGRGKGALAPHHQRNRSRPRRRVTKYAATSRLVLSIARIISQKPTRRGDGGRNTAACRS